MNPKLHSPMGCCIFEMMPVSMEFLRGVLGLIGIGCAFMMGRSAAAWRKGWQKRSRLYGWTVRAAACMLALMIRHPLDATAVIVWAAAAAALAFGYWNTWRARREEDLTRTIFPDEQ
jgi:hypothetical protein